MRKSRKLWLAAAVAAAALAATAVLVGAASGSSAVWLHDGEPLEEHVELSLAGGELIEVGASALVCNNGTATMTTDGGSAAEITAYDVDKASCAGLAGKLEGCTVTSATAQGLPWSVSVDTAELVAEEVGVAYSFDEACPIGSVETSFPELTLFPEEPSAIRFFHFGETGNGKVDGEKATVTDGGLFELPEAEFGTYGIG
jgi:hypothetical protein